MRDALFWPTKDAFTGWGEYLKISIPTLFMLCPEWWAFEGLIILSGYIGVNDQAVMVVSFNLIGIIYMFPMGFSEAAAAVVGNSMGENNPEMAKKYIKLTTFIATPTCLVLILIVTLLRNQIAALYFKPDSPEYLLLTSVMLVTAIESVFDLTQGFLQGPLRALTLQVRASLICIICNWVFTLPLAILFAFQFSMGIYGLWWGATIGIGIQLFAYIYLFSTSDYDKIAAKVYETHTEAMKVLEK